jgi:hypothetical protein
MTINIIAFLWLCLVGTLPPDLYPFGNVNLSLYGGNRYH